MKIDILTLFPNMFTGPLQESIIKRAQEKDLVKINIHDLRSWANDKHNTVDDKPYGGGPGMVIKVDVVDKAINYLKAHNSKLKVKTIMLSPQGKIYNQLKAKELSNDKHLILIAGHYEGFDQRIRDHLIDQEISIGNYVLTGGEIPAMVLTDSIVRLIPGVLGDEGSLADETHSSLTNDNNSQSTNIKYPVYTRPEEYNGWKVPEILLSGNHKQIEEWKKNNTKIK